MDVKNNVGGRPQTSGLFKKIPDREDIPDAPYDLEVFKQIFLVCGEPSGYMCALEALTEIPEKKDRWAEWKRLFHGNEVLSRCFQEWREELEIYIKAKAAQEIAQGCDPKDFARLKYIKDGNLFDKPKPGRPSKKQSTRQERTKDSVDRSLPKTARSKIIELGEGWPGKAKQA